jgi:putative hemolysin
MGLSEQIIERSGIAGLYTSTLFNYRRELLEQIGPAIELGRSFVVSEFQRDYAPLMLLWRGIARFMAAHPKYKMLFGPVSISNDYQSLTKHLLMKFLATSNAPEELRNLVSPKNPPRLGHFRQIETELTSAAVSRVEDVDELVNEIESDRAGMPILLRQYLKLNAKLLAFNVDPDFGDVLDGLMLADLTTVSRAMLVRYMGKEEALRFLGHWGRTNDQPA